MASRLFHAVVGVGIALGAASLACGGAVSSAPENDEGPTGDAPPTPAPPAPPGRADAGTDATTPRDATADAPTDASRDAPRDALVDAFCDAAWPTTKGNPTTPTCADRVACANAGSPFACAPVAGPFTCDSAGKLTSSVCSNGAWECPGGTMRYFECRCWAPIAPGMVCTDGGLVSDDGG